jgi:hypothetical protein
MRNDHSFYRILSIILGIKLPRPIDTTSQEVGMPHLLKNTPDKLYNFCNDQILQMTEMANVQVIIAREIRNTVYFTAGSFLTIALPIIITSEKINLNFNIFYTSSLMLLVSLFLGIAASLKEQKFEHQRILARKSKWELAKMCILKEEIDRAVNLLNENRSNDLFGADFWRFYRIITIKDIALLLFFLGVLGIIISVIFR